MGVPVDGLKLREGVPVDGLKLRESTLLPETEIARRVPILAGMVEQFAPDIAVAVPMASFVFAADLLRCGTLHRLPLFFLNVIRRSDDKKGWLIHARPRFPSLRGLKVLLIESCLDSGLTLAMTKTFLAEENVDKVMSLVAVDKNQSGCMSKCSGALLKMEAGQGRNYIFGYGLDRKDGTGRGLPYIAMEE